MYICPAGHERVKWKVFIFTVTLFTQKVPVCSLIFLYTRKSFYYVISFLFLYLAYLFFSHGATAPVDRGLLIIDASLSYSVKHSTVGRTPLDKMSARQRRDLHLTTNNIHSIPLVRFEPAIPASGRPRTHAFDRAATGIGLYIVYACAPHPPKKWQTVVLKVQYRLVIAFHQI
jgi:hypothetical protein